jgi:CMP-N-acetylneuraminic acid synthetase
MSVGEESNKPDMIALVPMRHHSERVPGKNYRMVAGRPLYAYILETLLSCPEIREIVIDTDSPVIIEGVARSFPSVRLVERPEHLRGGEVSTNAVIEHDLQVAASRFYVQTHSTNPLLRPETVSRAIQTFLGDFPAHDSLFSVTRRQKRLWDKAGRPVNHDPAVLLRTQDLPPLYEENSCIYLFEREIFLTRKNRLGAWPAMFEMAAEEALDIDEESDLAVVEALLTSRRMGPRPATAIREK